MGAAVQQVFAFDIDLEADMFAESFGVIEGVGRPA